MCVIGGTWVISSYNEYLICFDNNSSIKKNQVLICAPLGGLEPPTFRLTAERANHCATEASDGKLCSLFFNLNKTLH